MSTGIGKHKIANWTGYGGYGIYTAYCPYCETECDADWVDVGIGMVQCGPFYCGNCNASEASYLDKRELTEKEKETGWYEPFTAVSEHANTCNGVLVDHQTALKLYKIKSY